MNIQTRRINPTLLYCLKFPFRGIDQVLTDGIPDNDDLATYEWARIGRPETRLFGSSAWLAQQPVIGVSSYRVSREDHWIWEGTGLREGDGFRSVRQDAILDGTDVVWAADGLPYVANTALTETPPHTLVVATLPTRNAVPWWCWEEPDCARPGWATIAIRQDPSGGVVATIGDRYWLFLESSVGNDPAVRRITRNLLSQLAAEGPIDVYDGYDPAPPP